MAVVWLGSRPDSVKYSDFTPLQILALLPPFGWLLRGGTGCGWGTLTWCLRLGLIYAAANMWARANDHQVVKIEDLGFFYHDYCCRTEWLLGMNIAMALAVAATLVSAYFLWRSQRSAIDQLGK